MITMSKRHISVASTHTPPPQDNLAVFLANLIRNLYARVKLICRLVQHCLLDNVVEAKNNIVPP